MTRPRALVLLAFLGAVVAVVAIMVAHTSGGGESGTPPQKAGDGGGAGSAVPAGWEPYTGAVPILEYHPIQPPLAGAAYPQLFVPQADFTAQMEWLDQHGYEGVTLDQVEDAWYKGGELPPKPVVITFDDGYRSQYVAAFPVLQRLGWPGVLDLKAANSDLPDDEARRMIESGWELASHTINHLDVTTLDAAQLEHEIGDSRRILERRFDVRVDNFCYPAGRYDDAAIAALKAAGYRGATTENFGLANRSAPYLLNRIEIELDDGLSGFVDKLRQAEAG